RQVMKEQHLTEGFDVGMEMSGSGAAFKQMLEAMRNGGKIALLGLIAGETQIDWNDVIFKGLTITGIYGRRMFETWYKMSAMIEAGLDLSPLVTHHFHYSEFDKGFAAMNSGNSGKVILNWRKD
ncbi:MAG: zinc-binding dehydrogenase, partial [Clostridia bacterium]